MPDGRITAPPQPGRYRRRPGWRRHWKARHRSRRASSRGHPGAPSLYRVGEFVGAYVTALVAFAASTGLLASTGEPLALPGIGVAYLGCGISLSRFLRCRVRWFRQTANIAFVVEVKLHTITSWPVSVPVFIMQVAIAKHL